MDELYAVIDDRGKVEYQGKDYHWAKDLLRSNLIHGRYKGQKREAMVVNVNSNGALHIDVERYVTDGIGRYTRKSGDVSIDRRKRLFRQLAGIMGDAKFPDTNQEMINVTVMTILLDMLKKVIPTSK